MKENFVLLGSGEFTAAMIDVDKYLLSLLPKNPASIAILPTAAGREETPNKWVEDGITHFKKLGAVPFGVFVLERKDADNKEVLDKVSKAHIIYFSGGDPGHLLHVLQNSLLWKLVYSKCEQGCILVGSSAGAMVLGKYVLSNAQQIFPTGADPIWDPGLNLVPYSILPHFDWIKKKAPKLTDSVIIAKMPRGVKTSWMGIDENTALVVTNGKAQVLGQGKVHIFKKDRETIYSPNDTFTIH